MPNLVTMDTIIVSKDSLQALLDGPNKVHVVGRALVVLFHRQTESEKQENTTKVNNAVGFTGADGRSGAITAKTYIKRGTLQDWQVERWTKKNPKGYSRLSKYWAQLNEAAVAKRQRENAA